ncbi:MULTISPECIES: SidA/IucD/PvdA family monooxygenase [unclassified Pseudonocardia]|uniref:lysine N(6)-hydroxylase/L-ornithine N(5)-oxygenase family protein n=1 Tax=unclassified Pseudonocardia TaxID=2619320 RepID=UPI000705A4DA|nr:MULTISPECIES: SidA/IucD/PvdA family monooxygenase [unclassified Pseudonocardia]ALL76430.1 L-lysine 6-monooxygenase [Pseudonocardia sp. EC080610-09]ALL83457.1 L-lysine 6-monooxygenase [Pseudonocardia sp. EC080619-01]OLM19269.1 Siderophore biosynthesis protein, monooxygenase [Pseudonocardia sp. Ae707_Ps1]
MATPSNADPHSDQEILDVVGVGFGPSNLGVAIALLEHNASVPASRRMTARFVERQERFGWHRGMLLEDATMQVSYLKDLVTLRNPTSSFSFLSYLHDRDRLADFINYGSSFPTRREFHDYLEWAAARVGEIGAGAGGNVGVGYGREVVEVVPVRGEGSTVDAVDVVVRTAGGTVERLRARNVILACGLTPAMPDGVRTGGRIWHNRDLLFRTGELDGTEPTRFAVVGAGQSAAETVAHLHRTFPRAEVHAVFARYGYSPADDTSFANRIFDPAAVDDFYSAPDEVKERILGYHANTNYSVVDPELIEELYRTHYHERVAGTERLRFRNVSRVADVVEVADRVELAVESLIDGSREVIAADAVVYATGYQATDPLWLLGGGLPGACGRDGSGRLDVRRDYKVGTTELADGTAVRAGIYLQGPTEHTHGITSTLLSNIAVRSGEVVASLAGLGAPGGTEVPAGAGAPAAV